MATEGDGTPSGMTYWQRFKSARLALIKEGHLVEKILSRTTFDETIMIKDRMSLEEMATPYGGSEAMFDAWDRECATASGPFTATQFLASLAVSVEESED